MKRGGIESLREIKNGRGIVKGEKD